jgi:GNAT superfamily N-acetyltransferase
LPWKSNGGLIENPKLVFRSAKVEEAKDLKALYENAWGCGITIDEGQIVSKIRSFPEGQIVGCESGDGKPVSMINIMLTDFDPKEGFGAGYEKVTGQRTFSTHLPFPELLDRMDGEKLPVALCVSIAVLKSHSKNGYAIETLNHAISFAEENGIIAVPYSAPRGFSAALEKNPCLDIETYLHMTIPSAMNYDEHIARVQRLSVAGRISRAFKEGRRAGAIREVTEKLYYEYQEMGTDQPVTRRRDVAFFRFFAKDGETFFDTYGRYPLIEDFCLMTGRKLVDPVMRMHVDNGARFIRDRYANITAAFRGSRPEDTAAAGYNVLLTYGYHPLLGQPYVE